MVILKVYIALMIKIKFPQDLVCPFVKLLHLLETFLFPHEQSKSIYSLDDLFLGHICPLDNVRVIL